MADEMAGDRRRGARAFEVGDRARRSRRIEARDIERFTEISGDRNPLHYDEALAARSRFGGIIVQGGVTSALLNALVAEDLPGPGSVFLNVNWNFRAPVRPGDVITAEAEVTAVHPEKPVTTLRTTITNQDGTVVLDGTAVVYREVL
jgi:acyl dehydratase